MKHRRSNILVLLCVIVMAAGFPISSAQEPKSRNDQQGRFGPCRAWLG